jgi:hypothetical protein
MVVLKCCVFVQHVILLDLCYSFEINQYLYTCLYSSCSAESRLSNEYNITIFGQKHSEKSVKLWVNSTKWVRTKIYLVDNVKERNFQFFCVYRVLLEAAHRFNPISRLIVRVLITPYSFLLSVIFVYLSFTFVCFPLFTFALLTNDRKNCNHLRRRNW